MAWRVGVAGWAQGLIWLGVGVGVLLLGLLTFARRNARENVTEWHAIEEARTQRNRRRAAEISPADGASSVRTSRPRSRAPRLRRAVGSRRTKRTWVVFAIAFAVGLLVMPFGVRNKLRNLAGGDDADRVWHEWHDQTDDGTAPLSADPTRPRNPRVVGVGSGETPPPMANDSFDSIPSVADVSFHWGAQAAPAAVPDLLLEIPHGATKASHFDDLAAELVGPFPADLRSFFFVNTDVGAPEVGRHSPRASWLRTRRVPCW